MRGINSCKAQIAGAYPKIKSTRQLAAEKKEYLERKTYLVPVPRSTLTSEDRELEAQRVFDYLQHELSKYLQIPEEYTRLQAMLQAFLDDDHYWNSSEIEPVLLPQAALDHKGFWLYQNNLYRGEFDGQAYSVDQRKLLIMEYCDKDRRRFERLTAKFNSEKTQEIKYPRPNIPEEVRVGVWRRDQGKCARCDGRRNLEYDHIIPVSKGGSNTIRNIELLCEECNRQKRDEIR
jgi:hypothetical protein